MESLPVVKLVQGDLRGRKVTASSGAHFYSFQGIPYAKPPLGNLRFKAPQPPESWEGVRDAFEEGPISPQISILTGIYTGEEDCLYLNVYTPELPTGFNNPLRAVMVWIHGGGFLSGSGSSEIYGPEYLVSEGVVLVTLNYRLGALGFLSLGIPEVPGNAGARDQVAALRWLQQNVSRFGGDPDNVTLFGHSSGSGCAHAMMLSPMTKGLFHKVIMQSGSVGSKAVLNSSLLPRAFVLGDILGLKTRDPEQLLQFLQKLPARDIIKAQCSPELLFENDRMYENCMPFTLTLENDGESEGGEFLRGNLEDMFNSAQYCQIPFIIGVTSHEGIHFLPDALHGRRLLNRLERDPEYMIPSDIKVERGTEASRSIAERIKKTYFANTKTAKTKLMAYVEFFSDVGYFRHFWFHFRQHQSHRSPFYMCVFSFDGLQGMYKLLNSATSLPGACHGDELGYLFSGKMAPRRLSQSPDGMAVLKNMVKMWTNFSKTGNPTSGMDVTWEPANGQGMKYLDINEVPVMKTFFRKKNSDFWDKLADDVRSIHMLQ